LRKSLNRLQNRSQKQLQAVAGGTTKDFTLKVAVHSRRCCNYIFFKQQHYQVKQAKRWHYRQYEAKQSSQQWCLGFSPAEVITHSRHGKRKQSDKLADYRRINIQLNSPC